MNGFLAIVIYRLSLFEFNISSGYTCVVKDSLYLIINLVQCIFRTIWQFEIKTLIVVSDVEKMNIAVGV